MKEGLEDYKEIGISKENSIKKRKEEIKETNEFSPGVDKIIKSRSQKSIDS